MGIVSTTMREVSSNGQVCFLFLTKAWVFGKGMIHVFVRSIRESVFLKRSFSTKRG